MTHADIRTRVLYRLEADPSDGPWKAAASSAINEGQRLFAFLTLCLEAIVGFPMRPGAGLYHMLAEGIGDWILPLRVELAGAKLRPATLHQMACENSAWLGVYGTPTRYDCLGWDLLVLNKTPTATPAMVLTITYARCPLPLLADDDVPELHDADHEALVDYGEARLRGNEGGQELTRATALLQSYLTAAKGRADQVRARCLEQDYDREPPEINPELRQIT